MEGENQKKQKNNNAVLVIIAVATLLVALVGATFAYFTATVNNESAQSIEVTTASPAALEYISTGTLALTNASPGPDATRTMTFTVKNPSTLPGGQANTKSYKYDLYLHSLIDEFSDASGGTDQLMLSVTQTTDGTSTLKIGATALVMNLTNGTQVMAATRSTDVNKVGKDVVIEQEIAPGEKHTYSATIEFRDTGVEQNSNQNKTYSGYFEIDNAQTIN